MAKVKVKKQETFIDMTAMSDVTVLLLTFFMLTSTFIKPEPVQVTTPASVSEFKIPETDLLTILLDSKGKVFMSLSNQADMISTLKAVGEDYGFSYTPKQLESFKVLTSFGVPIRYMANYLDLPQEKQDEFMKDLNNIRVGIPTADGEVKDAEAVISSDNEFKRWITHAKTVNPELQIAIKADKTTNYLVVKEVMDYLRDMRENRYLLITSLKAASDE